MYFHTAGHRFPYTNMHYVAVAGGNAFYEKRDKRMAKQDKPDPQDKPAAPAAPALPATVLTFAAVPAPRPRAIDSARATRPPQPLKAAARPGFDQPAAASVAPVARRFRAS